MSIFNIIGGIFLIITSILIVVVVSMQESKKGMSALGGGSSENMGRNYGRTRDAMLIKTTRILAAVFFGLTILVSLVDKFVK